MSITVNGQSCVPPGFRFHPTEEELLSYYLKKKVASEKIDLDVIRDIDLNKLEPWDIQEKCRIGSGPQNDWYFFTHKDKKYPTGTRTNRATAAGFWKATGRDKVISTSFKRIGMRKTLVFYKGRAPHGQKSDWIMHEYRPDDHSDSNPYSTMISCSFGDQATQEDGWVVCRVFKKKNILHQHNNNNNKQSMCRSPSNCSSITSDHKNTQILHPANTSDETLEQILQYMGRSCKQENNHLDPTNYSTGFNGRFMKLPALDSPLLVPASNNCYDGDDPTTDVQDNNDCITGISDWAALDRLAAFQLNGGGDGDLWSFTRSVSSLHDDNMTHHM